jgi:exopolysaccharide biosynthesis polyprenyl glycosylphosphotransferase
LGAIANLAEIAEKENLQRILCTNREINNPFLCRQICQLRYSGVTVMSLVSVCEEVYHCVPVDLITPEWLLHASGLPHMLYLRKLKRGFDVVCSALGLLLLGPIALAGMLLISVTSPGPVLYRQKRVGRFGRIFEIVKLRTMAVDAEKDGAVWARQNDNRVTAVGRFLRKYRIDEIPQLINVLRGEMSFVGPRPERPEFIESLAQSIPYYMERLMVQPGITGWAQVNYPYGASVEDARRKLEYDLYYTKHMSLFLDVFSLLDTVRIIVRGGLRNPQVDPWRPWSAEGKDPSPTPAVIAPELA